jgi:hypothetical protein
MVLMVDTDMIWFNKQGNCAVRSSWALSRTGGGGFLPLSPLRGVLFFRLTFLQRGEAFYPFRLLGGLFFFTPLALKKGGSMRVFCFEI